MRKIRFGILSTAKIGVEKVIPAMQEGTSCEITAIASRNPDRARHAAEALGIPRSYGTYEELLEDKEVDAIYNPLPNHLHVPWSIKAIESGKHVLCEKPVGLTCEEARYLLETSKQHPEIRVMEAFMYRHHPRWKRVRELIAGGMIGDLKSVHTSFSYFNTDPDNIRNQRAIGGGGLMDVGCYCISLSRFLFGREPEDVSGFMETDPVLKTDRLTSGILRFGDGMSVFTCSTQSIPYQYLTILGTKGMMNLDWPFTPPPELKTSLTIQTEASSDVIHFDPCNQYTLQGDLFARSILDGTRIPTPLEDAVNNMKVIDRIKELNDYSD